ncbi:SNF2-related protein [Sulfurimonas sp.]|uniref:SNF2-related protein n=1 Tax=Sulfurimonas sp. TaxID=2022749 RepID=UPI002616D18D|nr:SNF2-related protein [Sulfurimonas sp.]MDD3854883.1 SNF2-related protein [Sulfurimonas sp.]
MFSKLFKKHKKELKDLIDFKYDDKSVNITINLNDASLEVKSYLELVIEELEDEDIGIFKNNILVIPHKNVHQISEDNLKIFSFPDFFDGTVEVELQGLINQDNSKFIIHLFDSSHIEIIPYKILGSILHITAKTYLLLPEYIYNIFVAKDETINSTDFQKYQFIELLQNDVTDKVKFNGFSENDFVETVSNIELNIREDENHNIILSPKIADLDNETIKKYQSVIDSKDDSLLITQVYGNSTIRNIIDEKNIKVIQAINKDSVIPKEKAGLFFANPMSHFEDLDIDESIKKELANVILAKGYRIIGIGKPYNGYFGSVKIDTPLSKVLRADPSFKFAINKDEANEFIEENINDLIAVRHQLETAIKNEVDSIIIADRNFLNYELDTYLTMVNKCIKKEAGSGGRENTTDNKDVLIINPNDTDNIEFNNYSNKNLDAISTNDGNVKSNYINFDFTPYNHQVIALNWLIDLHSNKYPGCLLADDMGLGKTFEVISFIDYLLRKNSKAKILIVAPTVLIDNWKNEFENSLKTINRYGIKIIRGNNTALNKLSSITKGSRTEAEVLNDLDVVNFLQDNNIYITTYKTLQKYQFAWVTDAVNIDCIIYDEAQNIKNPNTLQTQAAKAVSSRENIFNILMSGTPIENELRDLWCLFDLFDPSFFGSWKNFKKMYVSSNNENLETLLRAKISNYMLRRMKNDILAGLPSKYEPKLDTNHNMHYPALDVTFNDKEVVSYNEIVNSSKQALTKLRDLRLYSLHPILLKKEKLLNVDELVHQDILNQFSKTRQLLILLNDIKQKNEKVIIFVISKSMQTLLQYTLRAPLGIGEISVINGENNKSNIMHTKLDNFKKKEGFNLIILSPLAAGVGLTINEANHVIHLERHWNPAREDQASDRVYRIGQTKDVYIHHIISKLPQEVNKRSFDEGLNQLIMNKKTLSNDTLIPTSAISENDLASSLFDDYGSETNNKFENIDNMTFDEFEFYVKEMFNAKGYSSSLTEKMPSDFGADVIAIKGNEIIAIQCKHSRVGAKIDKEAIMQLHSEAKDYYKTTKLIAITNTYFNSNTINLAEVHNVEIIDRSNILDY